MESGGRALDDKGALVVPLFNQTPNTAYLERRSQTMGDKLHSREGKSPDRQLRSLNIG